MLQLGREQSNKEMDLREHLDKWKSCSNLASEMEEVIGSVRNTTIDTINTSGLQKNIEDCINNIKLLDDHSDKFEKFSNAVRHVQEFADVNSEQKISIYFAHIIDNFTTIRQQNDETHHAMASLLQEWVTLEPKVKELNERCSQHEQDLVSLKTKQTSKVFPVQKMYEKLKVNSSLKIFFTKG